MSYGPCINGKQMPITLWKGSWAQQQEKRGLAPKPAPLVHNLQWPLGFTPATTPPKVTGGWL